MSEAQRLLEALVKATQPMDFCHVCQSAHGNFKDASNHKEWCIWAKADAYLAQPMTSCEAREAVLVEVIDSLRQDAEHFDEFCRETGECSAPAHGGRGVRDGPEAHPFHSVAGRTTARWKQGNLWISQSFDTAR